MDDAARDRSAPPDDAPESDLAIGGHEPAPRSDDAAANEARDAIQDAFDGLEAIHPGDAIWRQADRRADDEPAPATGVDDASGNGAAGEAGGAAGGSGGTE